MPKEKKRKKEKKHRSRSKDRKKKHKHKDKSRKRDRSSDEELEELIQLKEVLKHYTSQGGSKLSKHEGAEPVKKQPRREHSQEDSSPLQEVSPPRRSREAPPTSSSGGDLTLSIDETNRIRAKLGLKPLDVGPQKSNKEEPVIPGIGDWKESKQPALITAKDGGQPFVHKPAESLTQSKKTEKLREKLEEKKERRRLEKKIKSVKGLGESDSDDDTIEWVKKMRKVHEEKKKAQEREKLLAEMDDEFGVGELVEDEFARDRANAYTSKDLRGIVIEHKQEMFKEGQEVVLTLKDQGVLSEDQGNVLENVAFVEAHRTAKNIENRKNKAAYQPYDMEDVDEFGLVQKKNLLSKYDEELGGEKKEKFTLGVDNEAIKRKNAIKQKLDAQRGVVSLILPSLQLATEYYTPEEMAVKFKKPRKKPRKVRKKEKMLKADDLLGLEAGIGDDVDSLGHPMGMSNARHPNMEDEDVYLYGSKPANQMLVHDDDMEGPVEDLSRVVVDPEEMKQMRRKKQKSVVANVTQLAEQIQPDDEEMEEPVSAANRVSITLNETAEFCRSLGEIPTYGQAGNRDEDAEELMDLERELNEERTKQEEDLRKGDWKEVDADEGGGDTKFIEEGVPILEEEPDVGSGVAAAIQMAKKKGYLETNRMKQAAVSKVAQLRAHNYSIEDKSFDDDKHRNRGDRYNGPLVDFAEKDHYKPAVKLEYIDDSGRILNSKEAFRYLSHKFHGKGSGKNKTEKRMKKLQEVARVKEMSSTDTPLGTLHKLQEKQKQSNTPFLVLSGQNKQIGLQPISKGK